MKRIFQIGLLATILGLGIWLAFQENKADEGITFAPIRQLAGKGPAAINQLLARAVPAGEMDEAQYGKLVALRFVLHGDTLDPRYAYANRVLDTLLAFTQKPFDYQLFIEKTSVMNAYASPGGVIVITSAMLDSISTEAELASVLAHELGHVELGHCFSLVKFQLAGKKVGMRSLGQLADGIFHAMGNLAFNQGQEAQADAYAWEMLLKSPYDLNGMGDLFAKFNNKKNRAFGNTHPPSSMRKVEYQNKASDWYERHADDFRYRGQSNVVNRISIQELADSAEWVR